MIEVLVFLSRSLAYLVLPIKLRLDISSKQSHALYEFTQKFLSLIMNDELHDKYNINERDNLLFNKETFYLLINITNLRFLSRTFIICNDVNIYIYACITQVSYSCEILTDNEIHYFLSDKNIYLYIYLYLYFLYKKYRI